MTTTTDQHRPYPALSKELADSAIVKAYRRKTAGSERLAERARGIFPSGITHDVRYIEPHGIYVTHADGSHKWDVDGNEYVDYPGGHGALLLGHNYPAVLAAVQAQIALVLTTARAMSSNFAGVS